MAWVKAPDDHFFSPGADVRLELNFYSIPGTVDREKVREVLADLPGVSIAEVSEAFRGLTPFLDVWYVGGRITVPQTAADIRVNSNRVINALTRAWSSSTESVSYWDPSLADVIRPSTHTTVSLASLALIALVVLILVTRVL